jgi:hypothetical protein
MRCRLTKKESGLYRRHFDERRDTTVSFFISTALIADDTYHLLEEKAITPTEAKRLLVNNEAYAPISIKRELNLPIT